MGGGSGLGHRKRLGVVVTSGGSQRQLHVPSPSLCRGGAWGESSVQSGGPWLPLCVGAGEEAMLLLLGAAWHSPNPAPRLEHQIRAMLLLPGAAWIGPRPCSLDEVPQQGKPQTLLPSGSLRAGSGLRAIVCPPLI